MIENNASQIFKFWNLDDFWSGATLPKLTGQLLLAFVVGGVLSWLQVPVSWLIGPMLAGMVVAVFGGKPQPLPVAWATVGQVIIALVTATRISWNTLASAQNYIFPLFLCIAITATFSCLNSYLLSRWTGLDWVTAFIGCIPGASASIVAMSEDLGADAIAVAILQYLRILLVALIVPLFVTSYFPSYSLHLSTLGLSQDLTPNFPLIVNFLLLMGCGGIGVKIGQLFRFPTPLFFGPFSVAIALLSVFPHCLYIPDFLLTVGLFLIGLSTGLKLDVQQARQLFKAILVEILLVLVSIGCCFIAGYQFHRLTHVDLSTAILGSTPGGVNAMMATIIQLGGDSGLVLAMQMTRMLLILLVSPWLIKYLTQLNLSKAESVSNESNSIP